MQYFALSFVFCSVYVAAHDYAGLCLWELGGGDVQESRRSSSQGRLRGKAEQWMTVGDEVLWPALVQWQNVDSSDVLDFHKAVWTVLEVLVIKK